MTELNSKNSTAQTSPVIPLTFQNAATMASVPKKVSAVQTNMTRVDRREPAITSLDVRNMGELSRPTLTPKGARPLIDKKKQFAPLDYVETTVQTSPIKHKNEATEAALPLKELVSTTVQTSPVNLTNEETETILPSTTEKFVQPFTSANHDHKSHKALMVQYGQGNTRPVTPRNYLKTFNVRAPVDQVTFKIISGL
jgi:hypothetical protein